MKTNKIYLPINTLEAAKQRVSMIFDDFKVLVSVSGGKDSTVVFDLAYKEAKKRGLTLDVLFIDQEAELSSTIEMIKYIKSLKNVKLHWYQIPIEINVATTSSKSHICCWGDNVVWMREKEQDSIKHHPNIPKETYFNKLFNLILKYDFAGYANIGGVRASESPRRHRGLTIGPVHKGVTWGKNTGDVVIFYPIYDWLDSDVWHYIQSNSLKYNTIYDQQFKLGVPTRDMRVSSIFHESSIKTLQWLSKAEPDTWAKVSERVEGSNTVRVSGMKLYNIKRKPHMFSSWLDYATHLLITIIPKDRRDIFIKGFSSRYNSILNSIKTELKQGHIIKIYDGFWKVACTEILRNDFCFTLIDNYAVNVWQKYSKIQ